MSPLLDLGNEEGFEVFYDASSPGGSTSRSTCGVIDPFVKSAETGTYLGLRVRIDL